jgi:DNA polymerase III alpha subunit
LGSNWWLPVHGDVASDHDKPHGIAGCVCPLLVGKTLPDSDHPSNLQYEDALANESVNQAHPNRLARDIEIPPLRASSTRNAATDQSMIGIAECLQLPPTCSGQPVWFLVIEDESRLLQCMIFEDVYRRCGHVLYQTGAYLLEGRAEEDRRRGFSFIVDRIAELGEALATARPSTPPSHSSVSRIASRGPMGGDVRGQDAAHWAACPAVEGCACLA